MVTLGSRIGPLTGTAARPAAGHVSNQMVQDYLGALIASDTAQAVAELKRLWGEEEGDSGGWAWNREDVYDRRNNAE